MESEREETIMEILNTGNEHILTHAIKQLIVRLNQVYGDLQVTPLIHILMYRQSEPLHTIIALILCLIQNGTDINKVIQDTDDEFVFALFVPINIYLVACMENNTITKNKMLSIITLLIANKANTNIKMPNGVSIYQLISNFKKLSEQSDVKIN